MRKNISKIVIIAVLLLLSTKLPKEKGVVIQTLFKQIAVNIYERVKPAGFPAKIEIGGEPILASRQLPLFYRQRSYSPLWSHNDGPLSQADDLIETIKEADQEGLNPDDYHLAAIEPVLAEVRYNMQNRIPLDIEQFTELDLLLTDAFLIYTSHLLDGRINPETAAPNWSGSARGKNLFELLQGAVNSGRVKAALESLIPRYEGYGGLKKALKHYRNIASAGGWPAVPEGGVMRKWSIDKRVIPLRKRLFAEGYLKRELNNGSELFDESLRKAVREFQADHGLRADGIAGSSTTMVMSAPVEKIIRQIKLNLDRWRWLPDDLGEPYILVNMADFKLCVIESSRTVMEMGVIIGKPYRQTPSFSSRITHMVLCPGWNIPKDIAIESILPLIQRSTDYFMWHKVRIFKGSRWNNVEREISPEKIKWDEVTPDNLDFRFRQEPGPTNDLGRIKFIFRNKYDVYLHDTPMQKLFAKAERTFSYGCIRLENPFALAEYLLKYDPERTKEKLLECAREWKERTIELAEPVQIHLVYRTVFMDRNKKVQFRKDIYEKDEGLEKVLAQAPPGIKNK